MNPEPTIPSYRDLVLALEALTGFCEHADAATALSEVRLNAGSSLGIDVLHRAKSQIPGFQSPEYWIEVDRLQQPFIDRYMYLIDQENDVEPKKEL